MRSPLGRSYLVLALMLGGLLLACNRAGMPPVTPAVTLEVMGQEGWQATGVQLKTDDRVTITYLSGLWQNNTAGRAVDARGYAGEYPQDIEGMCGEAPLPGVLNGALVGRIGEGPAFLIGNYLSFMADRDGGLWLRMNDADACLNDNGGSLKVEVRQKH